MNGKTTSLPGGFSANHKCCSHRELSLSPTFTFNHLIATIIITYNGSFTLPDTETDSYIMCIEPMEICISLGLGPLLPFLSIIIKSDSISVGISFGLDLGLLQLKKHHSNVINCNIPCPSVLTITLQRNLLSEQCAIICVFFKHCGPWYRGWMGPVISTTFWR